MDENDDKLLAAYDLSAWEAPPAPDGLVDRVIERARMPAAPMMKAAWKWKRTALIAGGVAAALAAAVAFVVFGTERAPQNGGGLVRASNAQRLDLGTSFATLDAGTELHWQRRGSHVDVVQLKGAAVWNVSPKDTVVIEAEDSGATVASVEATGASLRTEVQMLNRTDARVIGVGSAVAAVVAITTVVVYEGHVKATSNGQVVNIQSGSTAQFPPSAPGNQPPDSQYAVGAGPTAPSHAGCDAAHLMVTGGAKHEAGNHVDALIDMLQSYACQPIADTAWHVAIEACHAHDVSHALEFYNLTGSRSRTDIETECAGEGIDIPTLISHGDPTCDAAALRHKGEDYLNNGMDTAALNQFEKSLQCKEDVAVQKMAYIASCRLKNLDKAAAYFTYLGAAPELKAICLRFGLDPSTVPIDNMKKIPVVKTSPSATCDEVSCVLNNYEGACCASFKQQRDAKAKKDRALELAKQDTCDETSCVMGTGSPACCAKYQKSDASPPQPKACDAKSAQQKGENYLDAGKDTEALSMFELSLKCEPNTQVMKMAYIASCRLKNATKAKQYFKKLGSQSALIQVCMRFGIDPSE